MLVYIACPYSHSDPAVRLDRFHLANKLAAYAMMQGHCVFSPISHSHPIAENLPPELLLSFEFWMEQDKPLLRKCDCLWVYPPEAASTSRGVAEEVREAIGCGIPVRYITEDELT